MFPFFAFKLFQRLRCGTLALILTATVTTTASAQTPPPSTVTLEAAITYAGDRHPSAIAAREDADAARAGVTVARSAYLPRLDSIWQSNRATVNNVFGQVLPQSIVPSISGPVLDSTAGAGVWGSTTGGLLSWEPFDFGNRGAAVRVADEALARARAGAALTKLERQVIAAAAFLDAVSATLAVDVATADVARRDVLVTTIRALVENQLRPGAELSRAQAERAASETHLIQTREAAAIAKIALADALGLNGDITIDAAGLADHLPATAPATASPTHPLTLLQNATVDLARAEADVVHTSMRPKFLLQGSVSARGSGAAVAGDHDGGLDGLGLDRVNWAGGLQIVFPNLFDFRAQHARNIAADATVRAETARRDAALVALAAQQRRANARLDAARAIAANTPVQLDAAKQSESQSRARYEAGLTGVIEVADAQRLLAEAEFEDRAARIRTWLALLDASAAQGDLSSFISAARDAAGGTRQ